MEPEEEPENSIEEDGLVFRKNLDTVGRRHRTCIPAFH
jgi:hypothetical protein